MGCYTRRIPTTRTTVQVQPSLVQGHRSAAPLSSGATTSIQSGFPAVTGDPRVQRSVLGAPAAPPCRHVGPRPCPEETRASVPAPRRRRPPGPPRASVRCEETSRLLSRTESLTHPRPDAIAAAAGSGTHGRRPLRPRPTGPGRRVLDAAPLQHLSTQSWALQEAGQRRAAGPRRRAQCTVKDFMSIRDSSLQLHHGSSADQHQRGGTYPAPPTAPQPIGAAHFRSPETGGSGHRLTCNRGHHVTA